MACCQSATRPIWVPSDKEAERELISHLREVFPSRRKQSTIIWKPAVMEQFVKTFKLDLFLKFLYYFHAQVFAVVAVLLLSMKRQCERRARTQCRYAHARVPQNFLIAVRFVIFWNKGPSKQLI